MHADTAHHHDKLGADVPCATTKASPVGCSSVSPRNNREYAASLAQQSTHYEPPATGWHLRNLQSWQRSTLARSEDRDAARVSRHARVTRQPLLARELAQFNRSF
jgi:hypothetical protein